MDRRFLGVVAATAAVLIVGCESFAPMPPRTVAGAQPTVPEPAIAVADLAPTGVPGWSGDLDTALANARTSHRKVVVGFSATWCKPCTKLKDDVLSKEAVSQALAGYERVLVDIDRHPELATRYQVNGTPTVMVLNADGTPIKREVGYMDEAEFLAMMSQVRGGE